MKQKITFLGLATILLLTACKKEQLNPITPYNGIDQSKVFKLPTTPEEIRLVENLKKTTTVFKELYKENKNLRLVNAAIFSKVYSDESVLLRDLIYPEISVLKKSSKFLKLSNQFKTNLDDFASAFWKEANKVEDIEFEKFLIGLNNQNVIATLGDGGGDVSVYFPYSEEFVPQDPDLGGGYYGPVTSISTATADADEGWGEMPYYINGVFQYYSPVLINDEFAYENPTHIIGVNGIEYYGDDVPMEAPPPPPPPPGISRVFIGEGLCKKQYDKLISFSGNGGGSEIKYNRLTGYLQPVNGQVTTFQDIVSVGFSRKDIRDKRWKKVYTIWHPDWVPNDNEQVMAIYEEDNTNSQTITGSLGTTLTISPGNTVTGSIGYTLTIQSQDDIIRQLKISRHTYFGGAFQDQGWGFSDDATFLPLPFTHGWPRIDGKKDGGAEVCWTWPYNVYP